MKHAKKYLWFIPTLSLLSIASISASCAPQIVKKDKKPKKSFFERYNVTEAEMNLLLKRHADYVNIYDVDDEFLKKEIDLYREIAKKVEISKQQTAELIDEINNFYEDNYAKLINEDLRNYYLLYKNKIIKSINIELQEYIEKQNSKWINNDYAHIRSSFSSFIKSFKNDKWLVFSQNDSVDVSSWVLDEDIKTWYTDSIINDYNVIIETKKVLFAEKDAKRFSYGEATNALWPYKTDGIDEEILEFRKKVKDIANKEFQKIIATIKNIIPTIISKNWDLEHQILALAKYLVVKVDYVKGYDNKYLDEYKRFIPIYSQQHILSLNNKIAQFNCMGYTSFIQLGLNALGHNKDIDIRAQSTYYRNYRYRSTRLPHVNIGITYKNQDYVIDATFADGWHTSDKDNIWKFYNLTRRIKENILIPLKKYLKDNNLHLKIYNKDHQVIDTINY
ncbi:hypothetical protein [Mycoplasma zalophi]|uniref:hypothetical protein n=1 Tax=Mycoplasma zalophi TaxID=191287 RepID=UPI001C10E95F|nr:hypothetical protein [Mycoplasma zalophi]MBU4690910.1 hypothetical protein [Mycoplasma zalophi]